MRIRPAHSTDADAINELLDQLGHPQESQTWLDDPASATYVADTRGATQGDADGDILGVIAVHICPFFERDGTRARIVALVVSDRARGQGIGSRLVATAESFATTNGCLRMEYWHSELGTQPYEG
jgi:GNAT superfamily N-acetyltransferase